MSIYRELFVEVPQQLLEAAVREAEQRRQPARRYERCTSPMERLRVLPWSILADDIFGWTSCVVEPAANIDEVIVRGQASCGHFQRARVDELALHRARDIEGMVDVLAGAVATQRACYCVPRSRR